MADSDHLAVVILALSLRAMNEEVHRLRNDLNAARLQIYHARYRAKAIGYEAAVFGPPPAVPLRRATFREVMAIVDANERSKTGGAVHE